MIPPCCPMLSKNPTHLLKHTASREGLGLQTCISHGHPRLAILSLGCSKNGKPRTHRLLVTSLNCLNPTDFQLLHVLSRATPPKRSYFPSKSKTCVPFTKGVHNISNLFPCWSANSSTTPTKHTIQQ